MTILVALLCAAQAVVIVAFQAKQIGKNKEIRLINFANLMYAFVYGLLPTVILLRATFSEGVRGIDTTNRGAIKLLITLFISIFVHFWLNLAYKGTKIKKHPPVVGEETTVRAGLVMLVLGFASLLLWTRAAGGVFEFIKLAPGIRGCWVELDNPFAFLQHTTKILMLAACILMSYWLQHKRKIWITIPAAAALYGAVLFIMAWDSRAAFGFLFMMIVLVYMEHRVREKQVSIKKMAVPIVLTIVVALMVMVLSEEVTTNFRGGEYESETGMGLFAIVEDEFGYILRTQQRALDTLGEPDYKLQIGNDLLNAVTAWVPTRFIPFEVPPTLWSFNTIDLLEGNPYTTIPTDFVSACILELGVLGLVILPLVMGWVLKKLDGMLLGGSYNFYRCNMKAAVAMLVINSISHFQFASIALSMFYMVIGHVIVYFCRLLENGGKIRFGDAARLQ